MNISKGTVNDWSIKCKVVIDDELPFPLILN